MPDVGRLTWHRTEVDGRPASYGTGGSAGPALVFLHGWGLGSRTYERAINRLATRGVRAYAPAMPLFGGTAGLPSDQLSFDGYADWVAAFMDTVGVDPPVLLIGHSFGGGVAIALSERRPDLVSYLVLLNAVGGVSSRPLWSWAASFARELRPSLQTLDLVGTLSRDVMFNLVQHPLGMIRAAHVARTADLAGELASVRARGTPVLVLTSDADAIIPRVAFEALCRSVGSDGQVVPGGHSWLLADPDAFDEVMGSLIDLQVAEHRSARAASQAVAVRRLLRGTRIPYHRARSMVREAPALWLMSESPEALAGDIALCHPKLEQGEVRAAARPMPGTATTRLSIVTTDRRGLLADSAAVLASNGLSIRRASAATWPRRHLALHSFVMETGAGGHGVDWERLGDDLKKTVAAGSPPVSTGHLGPVRVEVRGTGAGRSLIEVDARDQIGLFSAVCRCISDLGADIESVDARSVDGRAHDTFIVVGDLDQAVLSAGLAGDRAGGARRSPP